MSTQYGTVFEIVDYDFNYGSGYHEISMQSDKTKNTKPTFVQVTEDGHILDNYYSSLLVSEVVQEALSNIPLETNYFVTGKSTVEYCMPIGNYVSYTDFIEKELDNIRYEFTIYVDDKVDIKDVEDQIKEELDKHGILYSVSFINPHKFTVEECKYKHTNSYKFYDKDNFISGTDDYMSYGTIRNY